MLRHFIQQEKQKTLTINEVLAMSKRKGLRAIEYDKLHKVTLKTLLPSETSGVLILFMDKRNKNSNVGHYCLLFRSPQCGVVFFDAYGKGYQNIVELSRNKDKLHNLLKTTDAFINKKPYQARKHSETCGRHCVVRWDCSHLKPNEYAALMSDPKLSPDEIVILFTSDADLTKFKV